MVASSPRVWRRRRRRFCAKSAGVTPKSFQSEHRRLQFIATIWSGCTLFREFFMTDLEALGRSARSAADSLAGMSADTKNAALTNMAVALRDVTASILESNTADVAS